MLKSLVLANETTKHAYQELITTNSEGLMSQDSTAKSQVQVFQDHSPGEPMTIDRQPIVAEQKDCTLPPQTQHHNVISQVAQNFMPVPEQSKLSSISSASNIFAKYSQMWTLVDRLELGLRKLETAKWEHWRILKNLQVPLLKMRQGNNEIEVSILLQMLERGLYHFGLGKDDIGRAIASLKMGTGGVGMRLEVKHAIANGEPLLERLASIGVPWEPDDVGVTLHVCNHHLRHD